jgi:hypothetical protein
MVRCVTSGAANCFGRECDPELRERACVHLTDASVMTAVP